jgi:hypothetical protein
VGEDQQQHDFAAWEDLEPKSRISEFPEPWAMAEVDSDSMVEVTWLRARRALVAAIARERELTRSIREARELTRLEDDWDGEGSKGFSLSTWQRVEHFLLKHANIAETRFDAMLPTPLINPADEGSLDVFWKLASRHLLVNFPAEEGAPITYYGQNTHGDNTIAGRTTAHEQRPDLIAWLIQGMK